VLIADRRQNDKALFVLVVFYLQKEESAGLLQLMNPRIKPDYLSII